MTQPKPLSRSITNRWNAKAEMAMMGFTQQVESNDEMEYIVGYIANTLKPFEPGGDLVRGHHHPMADFNRGIEITKQATKNAKGQAVFHHVVANTQEDMIHICMTMTTDEDKPGTYSITDPRGVFGYVYNLTCPDMSELGYSYFKYVQGKLRRLY